VSPPRHDRKVTNEHWLLSSLCCLLRLADPFVTLFHTTKDQSSRWESSKHLQWRWEHAVSASQLDSVLSCCRLYRYWFLRHSQCKLLWHSFVSFAFFQLAVNRRWIERTSSQRIISFPVSWFGFVYLNALSGGVWSTFASMVSRIVAIGLIAEDVAQVSRRLHRLARSGQEALRLGRMVLRVSLTVLSNRSQSGAQSILILTDCFGWVQLDKLSLWQSCFSSLTDTPVSSHLSGISGSTSSSEPMGSSSSLCPLRKIIELLFGQFDDYPSWFSARIDWFIVKRDSTAMAFVKLAEELPPNHVVTADQSANLALSCISAVKKHLLLIDFVRHLNF